MAACVYDVHEYCALGCFLLLCQIGAFEVNLYLAWQWQYKDVVVGHYAYVHINASAFIILCVPHLQESTGGSYPLCDVVLRYVILHGWSDHDRWHPYGQQ